MLLRTEGAFFQLSLPGYASQEPQGDPFDDSWLRVRVDIAGPTGAWSLEDPCLMVDEVMRLAAWLETLEQENTARAVSFLEPMLLFRRVMLNGEPALRVHFGPLLHPIWQERVPQTHRDASLTFLLSHIDTDAAAKSLQKELSSLKRS